MATQPRASTPPFKQIRALPKARVSASPPTSPLPAGAGLPRRRPRDRHPRQQPRHLRPSKPSIRSPDEVDAFLRGQRSQRRATFPAYLPGMLKSQLGPHRLRLQRVRDQHPREMIHYGMTKTAQLAVSAASPNLHQGTAVTVNSRTPWPHQSEGVEEFVDKLSAGKPLRPVRTGVLQLRPTCLTPPPPPSRTPSSRMFRSPLAAATGGRASSAATAASSTIV